MHDAGDGGVRRPPARRPLPRPRTTWERRVGHRIWLWQPPSRRPEPCHIHSPTPTTYSAGQRCTGCCRLESFLQAGKHGASLPWPTRGCPWPHSKATAMPAGHVGARYGAGLPDLAMVAAGAQGLPGHPPHCGLAGLDRMRASERTTTWRPCAAASAGDGAAHLPEL